MTIFTVGHGTRTVEELVEILSSANIDTLVDVRSYPRSRTNPQFNKEALATSLKKKGIGYKHELDLGGRRKRSDAAAKHTALRVAAFRNYAGWMESQQFKVALDKLIVQSQEERMCIMCSETLWWRCHRRMISDALVTRGEEVVHLVMGGKASQQHELWSTARVLKGKRLVYNKL